MLMELCAFGYPKNSVALGPIASAATTATTVTAANIIMCDIFTAASASWF